MLNDWFDIPVIPLPDNDHFPETPIYARSPLGEALFGIFCDLVSEVDEWKDNYYVLKDIADDYALSVNEAVNSSDDTHKMVYHAHVYTTVCLVLSANNDMREINKVGENFVNDVIRAARSQNVA